MKQIIPPNTFIIKYTYNKMVNPCMTWSFVCSSARLTCLHCDSKSQTCNEFSTEGTWNATCGRYHYDRCGVFKLAFKNGSTEQFFRGCLSRNACKNSIWTSPHDEKKRCFQCCAEDQCNNYDTDPCNPSIATSLTPLFKSTFISVLASWQLAR